MAALVTKVCTSLNEDSNAIVTLHALGNAIPMAIDLALLIVHKYHKQVIASTNTSTVALQDDYIPLSEHSDLPPVTQVRFSSAVHIRLMHRVPTNTAGS
jgi:DNA-binding protein